MDELIDIALLKLLALSVKELDNFKPKTVAEKLAYKWVTEALSVEGVRGVQGIADRVGGRSTIRKDVAVADAEVSTKLSKILGGI